MGCYPQTRYAVTEPWTQGGKPAWPVVKERSLLDEPYEPPRTRAAAECLHRHRTAVHQPKFQAPTKKGGYWIEFQPRRCDECGFEYISERACVG